jgi:Peptidase family M28
MCPFYIKGSPVLFLFTGSHSDYHTATDDADKINAIGGARVAAIAGAVTVAAANLPALTYVKAPPGPAASVGSKARGDGRAACRLYRS